MYLAWQRENLSQLTSILTSFSWNERTLLKVSTPILKETLGCIYWACKQDKGGQYHLCGVILAISQKIVACVWSNNHPQQQNSVERKLLCTEEKKKCTNYHHFFCGLRKEMHQYRSFSTVYIISFDRVSIAIGILIRGFSIYYVPLWGGCLEERISRMTEPLQGGWWPWGRGGGGVLKIGQSSVT